MPSSVIATMNYDTASAILTIAYVSGAVYAYEHVPNEIYNRMKAAISKGTFLNKYIKGKYSFKRLS
jgi:hypothetical protein